MSRTMPKGVRLSEDELRRVARLLPKFPEVSSESDMLRYIFLRGLLLLEADLVGAGNVPPPEMTEELLVSMLLPRMLGALTLLERHGKLPQRESHPVQAALVPALPPVPGTVVEEVGEDMENLGADFL
jgi:hypothetical protein